MVESAMSQEEFLMFIMGIGVSIILLAIAICLYTQHNDVPGMRDGDGRTIIVLSMRDGDGRTIAVLHLFPAAIASIRSAAEWAKAHPEAEHVEIVLHGEKPDALIITLSRINLLGMVAGLGRQEHGVTL